MTYIILKLKLFAAYFVILISCIFVLMSCSDDDSSQSRIAINHYEQTASLLGDYFVYVAQEGKSIGSDTWDTYGDIEGFDYEWGFSYELLVKKEKISNPPQDASNIRTTLITVISKKRASGTDQFDIQLALAFDANNYKNYMRNDGSGYTILGKISVDCNDLCDELTASLDAKESLVGTFTHIEGGIKLIALKR